MSTSRSLEKNPGPSLKQSQAADLVKKEGPAAVEPGGRLVSLDAFRGATMLLMASAGFGVPAVAKEMLKQDPTSWWRHAAALFEHAPWVSGTNVPADLPFWGLSPWDLIQPAFMLMVGVSLPFSLARRQARGDSWRALFGHACIRALALIALALLFTSNGATQTNWLFTNVLAQIGLGYLFVFVLAGQPRFVPILAIVAILAGTWYAMQMHPLPAEDQWAALGMTEAERAQGVLLAGSMRPWSGHINAAADVDRRLLNLFPRKEPYVFTRGGYQTLNFVPSIATMLLGLLVGDMFSRGAEPARRLVWLITWGGVLLALGVVAGFTICPIVKRIWTPSWVLVSGGLVYWGLAAFYWLFDMRQLRWLAFPLVVVGMNSIVMYTMSQLMKGWTSATIKCHIHPELFSGTFGPMVQATSVLGCFWLVCFWLYRQRIFVRL